MKILRWYALKELIVPFIICLLLFTFIFMVGNMVKLADLLVNKGVGFWDLMKLILLITPGLAGYIVPTSILATIILVFGGFAQHNEITAVKASGVNIFRIMLPVIIVGLLLSLIVLVLNDQVLPRARFAYHKAKKEVLLKRPAAYLEPGRFIKEFGEYIILAQDIQGNALHGLTIYQTQSDKPTRTIVAERGEIIQLDNEQSLALKLYNGTSDEPNPDDPAVFYKLDFDIFELPPISIRGSYGHAHTSKKLKDMTIDELMVKLDHVENAIGQPDQGPQLDRLRTELHNKVSFSFASFVFVLVGLPLAIITRRGEIVVSFGVALAVVTVYYILFVWVNTIAVRGKLEPALAVWLPNIILFACGGFLLKRVVRL